MAAAAAGASSSAAGSNGAGGMEVDVAAAPSVMAGGVTGSVSVALHPLVILNISDHWIRMRSQEGRPGQVIGALIGRQEGRNIEVMNSFELLSHAVDGHVLIDKEYYYTKEEQFKQVFKELEFLGWYTTGGPPDPSDIHVHKQVCEIIESPLFLKLNPMTKHTDLPVSVFESVIDIINGEATMLFAELTYTLATEEAERIGVDHVARMTATGSGENSTVAEHLIAQHSAIKMLHSRVKLILEYVRASEAGESGLRLAQRPRGVTGLSPAPQGGDRAVLAVLERGGWFVPGVCPGKEDCAQGGCRRPPGVSPAIPEAEGVARRGGALQPRDPARSLRPVPLPARAQHRQVQDRLLRSMQRRGADGVSGHHHQDLQHHEPVCQQVQHPLRPTGHRPPHAGALLLGGAPPTPPRGWGPLLRTVSPPPGGPPNKSAPGWELQLRPRLTSGRAGPRGATWAQGGSRAPGGGEQAGATTKKSKKSLFIGKTALGKML